MKVALVHDYIKEYGGAERVLEALHELYPDAPVYTSIYLPEFLGPHKKRFADWDIRTSFLQNTPLRAKLISPMRLLAPFAFQQFDFSKYDVVIVSATGAYQPNSIKKKSALQVCYCHTPPRYLYGYATAREWKKNIFAKAIGAVICHVLRMVDASSAQNVDYFIANSEEVRSRIKKFYHRDATVIYPPVTVSSSKYIVSSIKYIAKNEKENTKYNIQNTTYYLAGGRLARPKHIDLIVKTCVENNLALKVFGKPFAGYGEALRKIARDSGQARMTVEFLGEVSDEEKFNLMKNAKAYIFAAEDEDFGITPVEVMASGTPVIAYRSGGVKETVVDGKTGVFFDTLSVVSLKAAIEKCEQTEFDKVIIQKHGQKFSKSGFEKRIAETIAKFVKMRS